MPELKKSVPVEKGRESMPWHWLVALIIAGFVLAVIWFFGFIAAEIYIEQHRFTKSKYRAFGIKLMSWVGLILLRVRDKKLQSSTPNPKHSYRSTIRVIPTASKPKGK